MLAPSTSDAITLHQHNSYYLSHSTMKSLATLILALGLLIPEWQTAAAAMTFENVDDDKCLYSNQNDTVDSCVSYYYNEDLNVDNVFEFDLDMDEILKIRADYETDVRPFLTTGKSTDDFCLTTPYDTNRKVSP